MTKDEKEKGRKKEARKGESKGRKITSHDDVNETRSMQHLTRGGGPVAPFDPDLNGQ